MGNDKRFHCCSLCGKKLIERREDGILIFHFGKGKGKNGESFIPVKMLIVGNLWMQCIRRSCRTENPEHWEEITFFPPIKSLSNQGNPEEISGNSIGREVKDIGT